MVSYNDIAKFTYYHENNKEKEALDLLFKLSNTTNVIDILNFLKTEKFAEDNSNIKLQIDSREVIVYKENFLIDIPESDPITIKEDEFVFEIDYPSIIDYKCLPMYCLKSISYDNSKFVFKSQEDYNLIPVKIYSKIQDHIKKYIDNINEIYYYKVGKYESRFFFHIQSIIKTLYLTLVYSYKNIIREQLFLMKEYNFTYETFDKISFTEIKHYLKEGIQQIKEANERNSPKTLPNQ